MLYILIQFRWRPYDGVLDRLPEECRQDRGLWAYHGWMIFWSTVEPHVPNRVCRQYGWRQAVPDNHRVLNPDLHVSLHRISLRGRAVRDWATFHAEYIAEWDDRLGHLFQGHGPFGIDQEYMRWYIPRTVRSITNPAHGHGEGQHPDTGAQLHLFVSYLIRINCFVYVYIENFLISYI